MLDGLRHDFRYGLRLLLRNPGLSAAALLALALGIGANTAIFSVVDAVLLRPLPYADPDHLYALFQTRDDEPNDHDSLSEDDVVELTESGGTTLAVAAYYTPSGGFALAGSGEPERVFGTSVTTAIFDVLGARPAIGRGFVAGDGVAGAPGVVVLSDALWRRRFAADPSIVGKPVVVDAQPVTVVGVMPPAFRFPRNNVADLYSVLRPVRSEARPPYYIRAIARPRAGASDGEVQAVLESAARRTRERFPDAPGGFVFRVGPLRDELIGTVGPALYVLLGAVALVLLIATANIANLLLARATARRGEMAVRAALGASRFRLTRQLLTESLILAGAGGFLGVILAVWGTDLLVALGPQTLPRVEEIGIAPMVLLYTALITIVSGLLCGVAPAFQVGRGELTSALASSGRGQTDTGGRRIRNVLVAGEFALAVMLLGGAGLLLRSFERLTAVDPGVRTEGVLTASLSLPQARYADGPARVAFFNRALDAVRALPGVEAAAFSMAVPPDRLVMTNPFTIDGRVPANRQALPAMPHVLVTPEYFKTLDIPLTAGRSFTAADADGAPGVVIINDVFARKFFSGEDPIGHRLMLGDYDPDGAKATIVGVVADVKYSGLDETPRPTMYTTYAQGGSWWPTMYLIVRTSLPPEAQAPAVRAAIGTLDPALPVSDLQALRTLVGQSVAEPRFRATLLGMFAAVALLLAAIGIYGILTYAVGRRTREIGLRMALGAARGDVVALVLRQGMALAGAGTLIGILGALGLSRLLSGLLFGVSPADPVTFAGVAFVMVAVAFAACWIPARRAAAVDPMVALRSE
ncbi:MAG TPA: ABC transporter permease [Candidatus Polarisedimenticolia bacterium]|nr:ABC transporter permease [Candidatus Polarisedimenticolia bacterium]